MEKWILMSDVPELKKLKNRESLWTQGNGYMGIRAVFEESYSNSTRDTLINGVFDCPCGEVPELANIPDATSCLIEINGEAFTMACGQVENYSTSLNMRNGVFKRSLVWKSPKGSCIKLEFSRMVSDVRKHIMAQTVTVTNLGETAEIRLITGVDGKVTNSGVQHFDNPQKRAYADGVKGLYTRTIQSHVDVAVHYILNCSKECKTDVSIDRRSIFSTVSVNVEKDETFSMEKIVSFAHSRDFEYTETVADAEKVKDDGIKYLHEAMELGYEKLQKESTESWEQFWNNSLVEIKSNNAFIDKTIIFAQYHLHIMASHDDNRLGIGAKALSGEGYMGHSFWDTEIFLFPYYLFNEPQTARRLLEYRYNLLDIAKKKAKKYGYLGAMYPWETAWLTDGECCIEYGDLDLITGERRKFTMGETEIHVTAGIAFAIWQYYCVTGDTEFMEDYGNEIIVQTALFWATRAEKKNGRYEILGVIGADEYKEDVDNNAYTNYMALKNLELAKQILDNCSKKLFEKISPEYDFDEIKEKINDVADNLYLPKPENDGIIQQFEGCKELKEVDISYYKSIDEVFTIFKDYGFSEILKMQVFKQADLVMLFYLMEDMFDKETIQKNFEYYEERTLHDSSLSMCIHALVAARLGINDMAEKLYWDCCCVDLGENTDNSGAGIHSASIGGIWLATIMGYGGVRITKKGLVITPVLPEGWKEYSFYAFYKGTKIKAVVNSGGCNLTRVSGDKTSVILNGKEVVC